MIHLQPAQSPPPTIPATHSDSGHADIPLARTACGHPEAAFAGPDGTIWPFTRQDMRSHVDIVARMVEDTIAIARDRGDWSLVLPRDLVNLGWPAEQVFLRQPAVRLHLLMRKKQQEGAL